MTGITAIGDLGYVGVEGIDIVPIKRAPKCELRPCDKQFNTSVAKIRALNEQAVAHFKSWRMMSEEGGRYRAPIDKFEAGTLALTQIDPSTGHPALMAMTLVIGLGHGAMTPTLMAAAYQGIPRESVPAATTGANILIRVGSSFGTAILTIVLQITIRDSVPGATGNLKEAVTHRTAQMPAQLTSAFTDTFWWATSLLAVTLIPVLLIPRKRNAE